MSATMDTNDDVLEKISTSDFTAGGLLEPEQFSDFFRDVQKQSEFLSEVRQMDVTAPSGDIPRTDISASPFQAVSEGSAPSRQTIDQPSVPFTTSKVGTSWEVTWEATHETIDDAESEARQLFVNRFSVGIERLGSTGDESTSGFTAINDGWLTLAQAGSSSASTYDHADSGGSAQSIDKDLFSGMEQAMPDKFVRNGGLVFLCSDDQKQEFKEALTERSTAAGDSMLLTGQEPTPYGYEIMTPLGWPDGMAMMVNPANLVYILQENGVRIRQATSGEYVATHDIDAVYSMFAKLDYQILDTEGVVLGTNIAAPTSS